MNPLNPNPPAPGDFPCIETRSLENCFVESRKLGLAGLFFRSIHDFVTDNLEAVVRSTDRFAAYPLDTARPLGSYQVHMEHYIPAKGWITRAMLWENVTAAEAVDILEAAERKAQHAGPPSPSGPASFKAAMGAAYKESRYRNLDLRDLRDGLVLLRNAPFIGEFILLPRDANRYVPRDDGRLTLYWTEDPLHLRSPALAQRTRSGTLVWPEAKQGNPERLIYTPNPPHLRAG